MPLLDPTAFAPNGDCLFVDGKMGMFPIVESVVAQRMMSQYCPRGAIIV